jgi:hypothetical protein
MADDKLREAAEAIDYAALCAAETLRVAHDPFEDPDHIVLTRYRAASGLDHARALLRKAIAATEPPASATVPPSEAEITEAMIALHRCYNRPLPIGDDDAAWTAARNRCIALMRRAATSPPEPRASAAVKAQGTAMSWKQPTHYCKVCFAMWQQHEFDKSWSVLSLKCGPCCDNVAMGDQIVAIGDAKLRALRAQLSASRDGLNKQIRDAQNDESIPNDITLVASLEGYLDAIAEIDRLLAAESKESGR